MEVSSLAKTLCMSPSQLYRKMTAVTGHTPINYIQHVKVKKACQLLVEQPNMCLAEIAERSGFNDYSNFLRTFKSLCGVPPSRYVRERGTPSR
nr:helix-turn-helix domain-containing protein [uncultured Porphyromonas sp.]